MDLESVLTRLADLPEEEQRATIADSCRATRKMRFVPLPGPQSEAYLSDADVLLFGGSPGGGKTALEVGLALNEHHRSLIVRKSFVDLDGVLHTLDNIIGKPKSYVGGNRPRYEGEDGKVIHFMGMGEDLGGKQGNPHDLICVGLGTPVLMANGHYQAVETVLPGDMVATLEGPRKVLNAFPAPRKPSVRVSAGGVSQVQSATHKLLTTSGWADHSGYEQSPPSETCGPTVSGRLRRFFGWFFPTSPQPSTLRARPSSGPLRTDGSAQVGPVPVGAASWVNGACMVPGVRGSVSATSDGTHLAARLQGVWSVLIATLLRLAYPLAVVLQTPARFAHACGGAGAPRTSALRGSRGNCSAGCGLGGGRTRAPSDRSTGPGGGLSSPLLLVGAGLRSPNGWPADGAEQAPTRSPRRWSYAHPYGKGERQSTVPVFAVSCEVSEVGEADLYDLEVEEVNHFITLGGFVNKNCIDEAAQLPEDQVRMLMGWLRTDIPGQRTRVVMGSNPPLDTVGDWLVEYFGPWLDDTHPFPAEPGELRYYLPNDNGVGYRECSKDDRTLIAGVEIKPQSRTFIPSSFTDNPFYDKEQYAASLAGLPDSVRNRLISGNFMDARQDDPWQAIPTAWVREAVMRWESVPPVGVPQCALGVDVAQGGADEVVISARHDGWFAPLVTVPGADVLTGPDAAGLVIKHRRDNSKVVIDIGGGWGGDAYAHLAKNGIDVASYMGVKTTTQRTEDNQLHFYNIRTMAYWRLREALNPAQPGGSRIQLPNDKKLITDLTTPRYKVEKGGIKLESKEDVVERLGRSPDRGDAVVMAWHSGDKMADSYQRWNSGAHKRTAKVVMGYQSRRR